MLGRTLTAGFFSAALILLNLVYGTPKEASPVHLNNSVDRANVTTTAPSATSKADEIKPVPQQPSPQTQEKTIEKVGATEPEKVQPTVKPAVQTQVTGCEAYRHIVSQYQWDTAVALAVMQAESGCVPNRNNAGLNKDGSVDYGLMQVNSIHRHMVTNLSDLYDPATNISVAYRIYQSQGWRAWSVYNNGKYQRYLK